MDPQRPDIADEQTSHPDRPAAPEHASRTPGAAPEADAAPPARKARRRLWVALVIVLLLVSGGAGGLWWADRWLAHWAAEPYGTAGRITLTVEPGSSARAIAGRLESAGLVSDRRLLLIWLRRHQRVAGLQAGQYTIATPIAPARLVDALGRGIFERAVTIPEGWTTRQIAVRLVAQGWIAEPADFLALTTRPLTLGAGGPPLPHGAEGYCFPDTYRFDQDAGAAEILDRMLARFAQQWSSLDPDRRDPRSAALSMHEVVTLASMVERETVRRDEMPRIASVYLNRLERRMRLQCCATVRFALGGMWDRPLSLRDLEVDSPFNTYEHYGLPPGPIANPGRDALEAVLRPAATDDLFYVARGDGTHVFTRTFREHSRATRKARRANPELFIPSQTNGGG